jgi:hypothetical protein
MRIRSRMRPERAEWSTRRCFLANSWTTVALAELPRRALRAEECSSRAAVPIYFLADRLAPKPANPSFEQAAAVPISGYAALQAARDQGEVRPGRSDKSVGGTRHHFWIRAR